MAAGPLNREKAWSCLLTNVLVLPGLGSVLGGRRVSGTLQTLLSSLGFALVVVWFVSFATFWLREGQPPENLGRFAREGVAGILMFLVAWAWSLGSGLALLRGASRKEGR